MALDQIAELEAVLDGLAGADIAYALCDGLALAIHGHPRVSKLDSTSGALLSLDLLVVGPTLTDAWRTRTTAVWRGRSVSIVSREGLIAMNASPRGHRIWPTWPCSKEVAMTDDARPLPVVDMSPAAIGDPGRRRRPGDDGAYRIAAMTAGRAA